MKIPYERLIETFNSEIKFGIHWEIALPKIKSQYNFIKVVKRQWYCLSNLENVEWLSFAKER